MKWKDDDDDDIDIDDWRNCGWIGLFWINVYVVTHILFACFPYSTIQLLTTADLLERLVPSEFSRGRRRTHSSAIGSTTSFRTYE
jgi:hypothetical protein